MLGVRLGARGCPSVFCACIVSNHVAFWVHIGKRKLTVCIEGSGE